MNATEREQLLQRWIQPSSDSEQEQQDRACRMVRDAVSRHAAFRGTSLIVFAKGSYANQTNVRRDSDVDIVVENHECRYYDVDQDASHQSSGTYQGPWTADKWRSEVRAALITAFGAPAVKAGNVAFKIAAVEGSRPSIDVVPSFDYYRYTRDRAYRGSCVWTSDGKKIVNWPDQQLANGNAKNTATGHRYKSYVRALKNAENKLYTDGAIKPVPSYLMECLVYNVPNQTLKDGTLDFGFGETLRFLYLGLNGGDHKKWVEPNGLKWLFGNEQKWTADQAKTLVLKTWHLLGYQ